MRWPWSPRVNDELAVVLLAKLLDAIDRKARGLDGQDGFPSFEAEVREMRDAMFDLPEVKRRLLYRA